MKRVSGFSLLEVLASLALLALILLGVYAGLKTVTKATHAGTSLSQRLDEIRAAQGYLRQTLSRALAYPWSAGADARGTVFTGDSKQMSFVAPGPGYLETKGVQLQQLRLTGESGHLRLEIAFSPLASRHASSIVPSEPEVLVSGVREGHFYYNGKDDNGQSLGWQPRWNETSRLPDMVGVALVLDGGQQWPVVEVPLRMDPAATNALEGLYRLNAQKANP
jgi:general secretion pathway protein J